MSAWRLSPVLIVVTLGGVSITSGAAPGAATTGEAAGMESHSIDYPGATGTVALDINAAGEIVGSYTNASGTHGYRRTPAGEFHAIDVPGANFTRVAGINSAGDMVGTFRLTTDPMTTRHGFLMRDGELTTIDPPGAVFTNPLGINSSGEVVGRYCTSVPCAPEGANVHGFLWRSGNFWTIDVPMSRGTNAWKINSQGEIVGGYSDESGRHRVFLLRQHQRDMSVIDLPGPGEPGLDNGGFNSRGDLVGVYCDASPCRGTSPDASGFLAGGGQFNVLHFPGATVTNAFGVNARGDIVGVFENPTGLHGFLLTRRD